jgi:hypothetical protein
MTDFGPTAVISHIEIPQCSGLCQVHMLPCQKTRVSSF